MITIKCKICSKKREVFPSRFKTGRGKYCSAKCFLDDLHRKLKNGKWLLCKECNKPFYASRYKLKIAKFCSWRCKNRWLGRNFFKGRKVEKTSGKNHWNWKGGISDERTKLWNSGEYNEWRKMVYERDNYTCQKCGDNSGNNLIPHHLEGFADYPKLRFDINNGITLCKNCHTYFHSKYSTHHNTKEQLKEFLNENQDTIITTRGRQIVVSGIS